MTSAFQVSNIKTDWGAAGDGHTDDSDAFQSALTGLWHIFSGVPQTLYIPTGRYLITRPLLAGGRVSDNGTFAANMVGDGMRSSVLVYNPSVSGNSFGGPDGGTETPCLYQGGQTKMTCAKFGIQGPGDDLTPVSDNTVGAIFTSSSTVFGGTQTASYFVDMAVDDVAYGVKVITSGNCENYIFENCWFDHCSYWGLRPFGQNTLNWTVFGGGFSNCGALSTVDFGNSSFLLKQGNQGSALSIVGGGIQVIKDVRFINNSMDIFNSSTQSTSIIGGSSTSVTFYGSQSGFPATINGFTYRPETSVIGGAPSRFIWSPWGLQQILASCCTYAPQADNGTGYIFDGMAGAGDMMFDGLMVGPHGGSGRIAGSATRLSLRANNWGTPKNPDLFTEFTGTSSKVQNPDLD